MERMVISRKEFRDRVLGCWLGKTIGGTLGAPYECRKYVNNLSFYDPVPSEQAPNDDLDLQLAWLQMMEEKGVPPRLPWFAEYWNRHLSAYPWNEYGFCSRNLERGLLPPVSGWFENYYVDEMGSPIRSEIWACVAPGDPETAAALAWMDSAMDHAGGEGTHGEMFWAAVESAAFVERDPATLIRIGLAMIPPACAIARVIREAAWCHANGKSWAEARERIASIYGHSQPCNAVPNHGFTVLGWLYGRDFGDSLCAAVNCGYDTDCTGATLGSVLGIISGASEIPKKWIEPVGTKIVLHKFTRTDRAPATLEELTDRAVALAERMAERSGNGPAFGDRAALPAGLVGRLMRTEKARAALRQDPRCAFAADGEVDVILNYGGEPVLRPGEARIVRAGVRVEGGAVPAQIRLAVPSGWKVGEDESGGGDDAATGGGRAFSVTALAFDGTADIAVEAALGKRTAKASFRVISPSAAPGFPSGVNVEYCPKCQGRKGACVCPR